MFHHSSTCVFGKTQRQRRMRASLEYCLLFLIPVSFFGCGEQNRVSKAQTIKRLNEKNRVLEEKIKKLLNEQNRIKGQRQVNLILAQNHLEPTAPGRDPFRDMRKMLVREFDEPDYKWRYIRPEEFRIHEKENPQDDFEKELLKKFAKGRPTGSKDKKPLYACREDKEKLEYQYYGPVFLSKSCVICHRFDIPDPSRMKKGDLLSVIQVRFPLAPSL